MAQIMKHKYFMLCSELAAVDIVGHIVPITVTSVCLSSIMTARRVYLPEPDSDL